MEPIFEIVCDRLRQLASLPFRPLCHGGSGGGKRGDRVHGRRMLRTVRERIGLRERPGVDGVVRLGPRMAVGLWVRVGARGVGGGPGVVRRHIAIGGLRTSLIGRRERRGKVEGGVEGVWGGIIGVGGVGVEGGGRDGGVNPRPKLVLLVGRRKLVGGEGGGVVVGGTDGVQAVGLGIGL